MGAFVAKRRKNISTSLPYYFCEFGLGAFFLSNSHEDGRCRLASIETAALHGELIIGAIGSLTLANGDGSAQGELLVGASGIENGFVGIGDGLLS